MSSRTTVTVRLDEGLKEAVEAAAAAEDLSVTQLVTETLRARVEGRCRACGRPASIVTVPAVPPIDREGMIGWMIRCWPREGERSTFVLCRARGADAGKPIVSREVTAGSHQPADSRVEEIVDAYVREARTWARVVGKPLRFVLSVHPVTATCPATDRFAFVASPTPEEG